MGMPVTMGLRLAVVAAALAAGALAVTRHGDDGGVLAAAAGVDAAAWGLPRLPTAVEEGEGAAALLETAAGDSVTTAAAAGATTNNAVSDGSGAPSGMRYAAVGAVTLPGRAATPRRRSSAAAATVWR